MVQMVREGSETGCLPNSSDFMGEFGVSRRTVARDLDLLRDEESTPLEYDEAPARLPADRRDLQPASGADQPPGGL